LDLPAERVTMSETPIPVLLVEDNNDDIFFMKRALKRAGLPWTLHVVTDGQQALNYLAGNGAYANRAEFPLPAFILLDLKLPYRNGLEILAWIRTHPELNQLTVFVLTSSPEEKDQKRAAELGAKAYFLKPPSEALLKHIAERI
jgi:CheY-like chemotaxis protein